MASVKIFAILLTFFLALAAAAPAPGYSHGGNHEHIVIHVPHHIHTVHHHHVKKVHVPVPVIKKVFIHEEPHIVHHGGWW